MINTLSLLLRAAIVATTASTATAAEFPLRHEHRDWELACDNTGTCRAAGYQSLETETPAVSVLLTRSAGPNTSISGELAIGEFGIEEQLDRLPDPIALSMTIDGRPYGVVRVDRLRMTTQVDRRCRRVLTAMSTMMTGDVEKF